MKSDYLIAGVCCLLSASGVNAAEQLLLRARVMLDAQIVASSCQVVVRSDGKESNRLSLGTYNKAVGSGGETRPFSIWMFEAGATRAGCSALQVGTLATLEFGDPGQLDRGGVITRGAGDGVRIEVRALDEQADFRDVITSERHTVQYPVDFAAKGVLTFQARPVYLERAEVGEYSGSLAFVLSYQ